MKALFLVIVFLVGCATQQPPTHTRWARIDGLRKAQNPWIETDFRQAVAKCEYEVSLAGDRSPDFIYPQGSDIAAGAGNVMRAEVARTSREGLYNQCMGSRGYYIESVETR